MKCIAFDFFFYYRLGYKRPARGKIRYFWELNILIPLNSSLYRDFGNFIIDQSQFFKNLKNFSFFSTVTTQHQRTSTVTTTSSTTEMTERHTPIPPGTSDTEFKLFTMRPKVINNNNKRINSEAAENAALIIGIIAGALIAIVLIILIILKFKNRPEANYKVDEAKTFCQDPNAALLGTASSNQPYNGALKNGANVNRNGKKREVKDIKEWYV